MSTVFSDEQIAKLRSYKDTNSYIATAEKGVQEGSEIFECTLEKAISAVMRYPQFVEIRPRNFLQKAIGIYGVENIEQIKQTTVSYPRFIGYDHNRAMNDMVAAYGADKRDKIVQATLGHGKFVGYNHARVLKEKTAVGRVIKLSQQQVIDFILGTPRLASVSKQRDMAWLDAYNRAVQRDIDFDQEMLMYVTHFAKSPYVKGTRLSISEAERQGIAISEMPHAYRFLETREQTRRKKEEKKKAA